MKEKRQPMRKCSGCGEMKEKRELVRVVRAPLPKDCNEQSTQNAAPEVLLDLTGKMPGRGAYVCPNPKCLAKARRAKRLERSFGCKIPDDVYDELERQLAAPDG